MASEPAHSDGLVGSGENLRQNVLLAASGTIADASGTTAAKRDSHIDIAPSSDSDSDLDKDSVKKTSFWQRVFNLRGNFVKTKSSPRIETERHDEKPLKKGGGNVSASITSLSTRSKGHIAAEKHQIKFHPEASSHGLEDTGDCISELIGHIGWWQVAWVTFLIMFQVPSAFHIFSFMFQAVERDFWCAIPAELEPPLDLTLAEWRNLTQPHGACTIAKNLTERLANRYTTSSNDTFELEKCKRFVFDSEISDTTIQSEWNVVCEDATLLHFIEMCFLAGAAIGSLSSGTLSDEYGRRHTLMIVVALQAIIGTTLGTLEALIPYMILRFCLGFVSMSIVNISFVLTVEMVTGKWSSIIGTLDILPLPLAYIVIAGLAYVTRNWRHLQFIVSLPWFGLLLFWIALPESPRWLLAKGRIEELKKIIETAARWNKRTLPPNYDRLLIPPPEDESSGSFIDLFKLEYLRTTLLLMTAWYCFVLQYMALTLHIGEMGGNIYLTTVYAGIFEALAILISIFTVTRFGIQKNIFYNILISGLSLMYIAIFPNADWTLVVFLTMLGKSTTGVANAMIPAFTSFQYPPTLRTRAMGMTNFSAGFALISVPYIWLLKYIVNYLPPLLLGSCGLIGALVLFFIDDRTAIILAAERAPHSKHRDSQPHLGK